MSPNLVYPRNRSGVPMLLLAQIDLRDLPDNTMLPGYGILQFFISTDELFGKNFEHPKDSDFKILFQPGYEDAVLRSEFEEVDVEDDEVYLPLRSERSLRFNTASSSPYPSDIGFRNVISQSTSGSEFSAPLYESYLRTIGSPCHQLGGYGSFCQQDPRERFDDIKHYVLLLQVVSDSLIQWGDLGTAQFLIDSNDLKNGNFSNAAYYWSCH